MCWLGALEHVLRVCGMVEGAGLEEGRIAWLDRGWPVLCEALVEVLLRAWEYVEGHTLMRTCEEDVVDDAVGDVQMG